VKGPVCALIAGLAAAVLVACGPSTEEIASQTASAKTAIAAAWTDTPTATTIPTAASTATATSMATITPTFTPTPTVTPTPIAGIDTPITFTTGGPGSPTASLMVVGVTTTDMYCSSGACGGPQGPDDTLLVITIQTAAADLESVLGSFIEVFDEQGRNSEPVSSSYRMDSDLVIIEWLFQVAKDAQSFTLHLPDGQVIDLAPLLGETPAATPSSGELPGYIDVVDFTTTLNGELLEAVFTLRELPHFITINRPGVPLDYCEYSWCALVFLDGTGDATQDPDYQLCAMRFVFDGTASEMGPIASLMQVNVWKHDADGYNSPVDVEATIEVDARSNTITLRGTIPGITEDALVLFSTYDYLWGEDSSDQS
jgi:hypothetical protein